MNHAIVFVHLGPALPPFMRHALAQANLFNRCPIYLLANQAALAIEPPDALANIRAIPVETLPVSERHRRFRAVSTLDRNYRGGFWTFATERFFYLESFMNAENLTHIIHLESDVMIYLEVESILPIFDRHYPNLAATLDNDQRCIPNFIYIRRAESLARLNDFMNDAMAAGAKNTNDMLLLAAYASKGHQHLGLLPIVPADYPRPLVSPAGHIPQNPAAYSNHLDEFNSIFDAAALGQYIGGVDFTLTGGRRMFGFINESCIFNPSVYTYAWKRDPQGRRIPFLQTPTRSYRINNLHHHSKQLHEFRSDNQPPANLHPAPQ